MGDLGRLVFPPLPLIDVGSRVRIHGDGPSPWSTFIVVARPRTEAMAAWGTLPGCYMRQEGDERSPVMGGKPLGVMRALVRDYSRPGDLVVDPCAGGATTLMAAVRESRCAVGVEVDEATFAVAREQLQRGHTPSLFEVAS